MPAKGWINPAIRDEYGNKIPWKKRNKEASNACTRARRSRDILKARQENRIWREGNPFSVAVGVARRRALVLGVSSDLSINEWRAVVKEHDFICHICGEKVSLEIGTPERLSLDHIIPMARGGANTKSNVAPAHRRCNQNRTDMLLEEFDIWLEKVSKFRSKKNGDKN